MNFLIAGGAGFLGSHLAMRLYNTGYNVYVVDDLSTGSLDNLNFLLTEPYDGFKFIQGDITETDWHKHLPEKLDGIFNLACPASPVHYQNIPIKTTMTCVVGAYNLLNLAKKMECRILQTSTSEIKGSP